MILIENRETRTPYVDVYTYNMIKRFTLERCTVSQDVENDVYVVTTVEGMYIASFPVKETAYILKTNESNSNITFV